MRFLNENRATAACLAAVFLTACAAEDTAEPTDTEVASDGETAAAPLSAESLEMAETAWLTVSEDGEVFTTYLDANGRYRDQRGGELAYSGTWQQNADRELCFSPDEGTGGCWSHRAPSLDGVMRATNASGRAIEAKRVAYIAPSAPSEAEAEADTVDEAFDNTPYNASGSGD